MKDNLKKIIDQFEPISLKEMDRVALLKRVDTKFLLNQDKFLALLERLCDDYFLLEIAGKRLMSYTSQYFDTEVNKFYADHHSGKIRRTKIRIRRYDDSDLFFLEIKLKDGKGNTNKSRIPIKDFQHPLTSESTDFISEICGQDYQLHTSLWNNFRRLTLVSKHSNERVTIDLDLNYRNDTTEKAINKIVIVELKQERFDQSARIVKELRKIGILPYGFSKYCIGMIQLYEDIKYNRFKPKLLKIKKITS